MIRPADAVLFQQGIDELNRWNFEDVADATRYSWYHGHPANPQLRTVTAVAHALGFDPRSYLARAQIGAGISMRSPSLTCRRAYQCPTLTERPTSR